MNASGNDAREKSETHPRKQLTSPSQTAIAGNQLAQPNRREFIGAAGSIAAAAMAAAVTTLGPVTASAANQRQRRRGGFQDEGYRRRERMYDIRVQAAEVQRRLPIPQHPDNGDEDRYERKIASYSKGLPHNASGEVDPGAYDQFLDALDSERPEDFEALRLGCTDANRQMRLVNPLSGLAFDLEGTDSHQFYQPPAPRFASAEAAGEMVELYWQALLRDVPFTEYATHPLAQTAASELSALTDFRGPRQGRRVTPQTLFRGFTPGDVRGPYISQFMLKDTPFGTEYIERRMRAPAPGSDFMTNYQEWLDVQLGCQPSRTIPFDSQRRYIRNGRDLAQWVHIDVLFQAYFNACAILSTSIDSDDPQSSGMACPLNPGNPYLHSRTQTGFGTFGPPYIVTILCEVATRALKAVWYQKWFVHRRLRPEAFGGRVHNHRTRVAQYPLHGDVLNASVTDRVFLNTGSYLLPMGFPEGSPLHPAYGAGHATVAGACVTILKALFDENYVIPNPVVPTADGLGLTRYNGPDADHLTVGGELNKLAANVGIGRNIAGVHWRSDYTESLRLGEAVAISLLRDQRTTYLEPFEGFVFTQFDGTLISV